MTKHKKSKAKNTHGSAMYSALPDRFKCRLSYDVRYQVNSASYNVYNFDLLEIQTLQPYFRDQLMALWQKYVVMGVSVSTRIVNTSTTVDAEVLTYYGSGTTVSALTFSQALEFKTTTRRMLSTSGSGKVISFSEFVPMQKLLKLKYEDDSDFWGNSTTKPSYCISSDSFQYATGVFSCNGTSTVTATIDRRINFHVMFFNLAAPSNSLNLPILNEKPVLASKMAASDTQCQKRKKKAKDVLSDSD